MKIVHATSADTGSSEPFLPSASASAVVGQHLGSSRDSAKFTAGLCLLCALVFCCGGLPSQLPAIYLLFAATAIPYRAWDFLRKKWAFFLCDFCYAANAAVVVFLLACPRTHPVRLSLQACVWVLAEGPLAVAILPWRCTWLMGSMSHTVSVLIHILPGIALYMDRHFSPPPSDLSAASSYQTLLESMGQPASHDAVPGHCGGGEGWWWTVRYLGLAPLAFYVAWQLCYFLIVQVTFGRFIRAGGYDTSYASLARRAAKKNNILNRVVRRGSALRRVAVYGFLQLLFTLVSICWAVLSWHSFTVATVWQVAKIVVPLWYGARYQCERLPALKFKEGLRKLAEAESATVNKY
ncbi:MAG: hypothetical protein WDW38_008190 [Sanguina aurantia]